MKNFSLRQLALSFSNSREPIISPQNGPFPEDSYQRRKPGMEAHSMLSRLATETSICGAAGPTIPEDIVYLGVYLGTQILLSQSTSGVKGPGRYVQYNTATSQRCGDAAHHSVLGFPKANSSCGKREGHIQSRRKTRDTKLPPKK